MAVIGAAERLGLHCREEGERSNGEGENSEKRDFVRRKQARRQRRRRLRLQVSPRDSRVSLSATAQRSSGLR